MPNAAKPAVAGGGQRFKHPLHIVPEKQIRVSNDSLA